MVGHLHGHGIKRFRMGKGHQNRRVVYVQRNTRKLSHSNPSVWERGSIVKINENVCRWQVLVRRRSLKRLLSALQRRASPACPACSRCNFAGGTCGLVDTSY